MCDTIAVVQPGRVLLAKNSDRDPNEAQLLEWHPRRAHAHYARLRCTWIEIDQVRETHAVLLSRPFWTWGAEMGANEHGVAIGNEAVFTRGGYAARGLTGMDLVRLGLERARSARQAVQVMAELLERHGQGGRCGLERAGFTYHNSFLVADPSAAFVLETVGRTWASEEVRGSRSISNGLTIRELARHADRLAGRVAQFERRMERTGAAARSARGPADLMAALRSHGESRWPRYGLIGGTLAAPCMHGGGVVASSQTTASWVAELRPGACLHWVTATSAPCLSLFKPVAVDRPLALGPAPTARLDHVSLFWAHERLHRAVLRAPEVLAPLFLPERDAQERAWLREPPDGETAFAVHRRLLTEWTARVERAAPGPRDRRPVWARRYWRRRAAWAERGAGVADRPAIDAAAARLAEVAAAVEYP